MSLQHAMQYLFLSSYSTHCEQEGRLEYSKKGHHYVTVHPPGIRSCDRCMRVWLHDVQDQCREASEGKETQPISRSSLSNARLVGSSSTQEALIMNVTSCKAQQP